MHRCHTQTDRKNTDREIGPRELLTCPTCRADISDEQSRRRRRRRAMFGQVRCRAAVRTRGELRAAETANAPRRVLCAQVGGGHTSRVR